MPIVESVTELFEGRKGSRDLATLERKYTRKFRVRLSSYAYGPSYAEYAPGIPRLYSMYITPTEIDVGALATSVNADQDASAGFDYVVTVEYSTHARSPAITGAGGGDSPNENPLALPPKVQWGVIHDTIVMEKDRSDPRVLIRNSVGQAFTPRPTVDNSRLSLTYTRNEAFFNYGLAYQYFDMVNQYSWKGFTARNAKLGHITAGNQQSQSGMTFWAVTYYIEFRAPDWDLHIVNKGTKERVGGNNIVVTNRGGTSGVEIFLTENGTEITADQLDAGTLPVIKNFKAYYEFDFNSLGFFI